MEPKTFLELAERVLEEERKPLSTEEIWECAKAKGYDRQLGSQGRTPWHSIGAQIYVSIRDESDSPFVKVGSRPRRFCLRKLLPPAELQRIAETQEAPHGEARKYEYLEKDLHPFLTYYAHYRLKAFTKTINHSRSGKKDYGEWVHPDMVGCYFPIPDWSEEVVELNSALGGFAAKIFSFELKRQLTFANLRESFFQTVSNSSWANQGFLAAAEVSNDDEFLTELRRLSTSFGIGVIKLDLDDPDSAEIVFPAQERENLDWETVNKVTINNDFREFLRRIKVDITSREIRKEMYDRVLERDELLRLRKKMKQADA